MRIAALIFGLLAGLFGAAVIVAGGLDAGLVAALGPGRESMARLAVYLTPSLGLLGAGIALAQPRLGGLFLLLSALAWLGLGFVIGHGTLLYAAVPLIFALTGGIIALFGREGERDDEDEEEWEYEEDDDEEEERGRSARLWPDEPAVAPRRAPQPQRRPAEPPPRRAPEPRMPQAGPRAPAPPSRLGNPPRPVQNVEPEFEPELEDVEPEDFMPEDEEEVLYEEDENLALAEEGLDADESYTEEDAQEPFVEDEASAAPAAADYDFDFTPDDRRPPSAEPEEPEEEDYDAPPPPRYAAARQPRPASRRQAIDDDLVLSPDDFSPTRRTAGRRDRDEPEADYGRYGTEPPPPRKRRWLGTAINSAFVVLVIVGIAGFVYYDYKRGPQSLLFGSHPAGSSSATTSAGSKPAPAAPSATPRPTAPEAAPAPVATTDNTPAAADNAAAPATAPQPAMPEAPAATVEATQPAPPPAASEAAAAPAPEPLVPATTLAGAASTTPASAQAATVFNDPFLYCNAVGTIDAPDATFTGARPPAAVVQGLQLPAVTDPSQIHWRCVNHGVVACNAGGTAACSLTPTVDQMVAYCARHPNAQNLPAPNGSWSCNGQRPVIPQDQQWPVDARGFYPGAWHELTPPSSG